VLNIAKTIPSRPVYESLHALTGSSHLLVADGAGGRAILDFARQLPADWFAAAHVIYVARSENATSHALQALRPRQWHWAPSIPSALPRLSKVLEDAHMGLRLYLAGTEGLIGEAMQVALDAGIDHTAICTEHRGSLMRRMQCVHCKGISENVTTQPSQCAHCGLWLLVRDHYSRRLGAFQGVCIHAEEPANIPPAVETFV
jgi:hypothetical protein